MPWPKHRGRFSRGVFCYVATPLYQPRTMLPGSVRSHGRGGHTGVRWIRGGIQLPWILCALLSGHGAVAVCRPVNCFRILGFTRSEPQRSHVRSLRLAPVGFCSMITFALCTWIFFRGPEWAMFVVAVPMMYSAISGNVVIMALSSELFPTTLRGTSAGSVMLLGAAGAGIGLLLVGALTVTPGDIITFVPVFALSTVWSAILMLFLPETKARELEAISWQGAVPAVAGELSPGVEGAFASGAVK